MSRSVRRLVVAVVAVVIVVIPAAEVCDRQVSRVERLVGGL
jgi:hypothetical protein